MRVFNSEVKVNHFSEVTLVANAAKSVDFDVEHKFTENSNQLMVFNYPCFISMKMIFQPERQTELKQYRMFQPEQSNRMIYIYID